MTIKECYALMEGDYDGVMGRLRKEERVMKFLLRFPEDPSFQALKESLGAENYEEAFRAAHTLKGVCQNLGLEKLYQSCSEITEKLRDGRHPDNDRLFCQVEEDYLQTVTAIRQL